MAKKRKWPGEPDGLWAEPRPAALRQETRSAPERLLALDDALVIPYPRAARIESEIESLIQRKTRSPYSGAMIVGPRSNGRSTVARQIVDRLHNDAWLMSMPTRAAYDDFWLAIIAKDKRLDYGPGLTSGMRQIEAHRILDRKRSAGLRLVIVDGCDNLLDVSPSRRRLMLHCVDSAWRASKIPFVLIGTPVLASRILAEKACVGAYELFLLPPWRLDSDFLDLLEAWDDALPLQHSSGLAERELAMHLYAVSEGLLGALAAVLVKSSKAAILTGQEKITISLLDEIGLEVPSTFTGFFF